MRCWLMVISCLVPAATVGAEPTRVAHLDTAASPVPVDSDLPGVSSRLSSASRSIAPLAVAASPGDTAIPDLKMLTTQPVAAEHIKGDAPSSGYGWRDDPLRHDAMFHHGTDFRADPGTPVLAAGPGTVVFAGRRGGYGNEIDIDHGGGVITRYAHLRRIETKLNASVAAGDRIGQVGATGRVTGPHLHFEVRLGGRSVDPLTAMSVAELERESPTAGQIAALALAPELQAHAQSRQDPPRTRRPTKPAAKPEGSRPDRPGHTKAVRPVS